jgi:hypothetical protein
MPGRGRERWSNRRVVEDCLALDIAKLVRAGVFRSQSGVLSYISWLGPSSKEVLRARCVWENGADGRRQLHLSFGPPEPSNLIGNPSSQTIEIVQTPLHFGPRPWFLCPGLDSNSIQCRNRVRILYLVADSKHFGCRRCLHLIHRSAREHDARIDKFLRLPPESIQKILVEGTIWQKLLAVRATTVLLRKLRKTTSNPKLGQRGRARKTSSHMTSVLEDASHHRALPLPNWDPAAVPP